MSNVECRMSNEELERNDSSFFIRHSSFDILHPTFFIRHSSSDIQIHAPLPARSPQPSAARRARRCALPALIRPALQSSPGSSMDETRTWIQATRTTTRSIRIIHGWRANQKSRNSYHPDVQFVSEPGQSISELAQSISEFAQSISGPSSNQIIHGWRKLHDS